MYTVLPVSITTDKKTHPVSKKSPWTIHDLGQYWCENEAYLAPIAKYLLWAQLASWWSHTDVQPQELGVNEIVYFPFYHTPDVMQKSGSRHDLKH